MTWEDQYRKHRLWNDAQTAMEKLGEIKFADRHDEYIRLMEIVGYITDYSDSPNFLITEKNLKDVDDLVLQIISSTPSPPGMLNTGPVSRYAESLAAELKTWPQKGTVSLKGLSREMSSLKKEALNLADGVKAHSDQLARQGEQFETAIKENLNEFEQERTKIQEGVSDLKEALKSRNDELNAAFEDHKKDLSAKQELQKEEWDKAVEQRDSKTMEHLAQLNKYEEQAKESLQAVGGYSTAKGYSKYADDQKKAADKWRAGAVVAYSIAAGFVLIAATLSALHIWISDEWWQTVASKITGPASFAAIGYFLARESGQHRREERRANQVALTLGALEPFIVNLSPEQQEKIRTGAALEIFAQRRDEIKLNTPKASSSNEENSQKGE